ncbi:hypothetical protein CSIM01_05397 [Colletotrichum simmondsii]|uniref:Uncharacterized protein n=1 Tax=Colletotrichum simmondsii TaxID=703756 RepID=A0A135TQB8_9PEZI|nr:hypothetical protein CSIM01_05397 [Colletotrichum simmondsii]
MSQRSAPSGTTTSNGGASDGQVSSKPDGAARETCLHWERHLVNADEFEQSPADAALHDSVGCEMDADWPIVVNGTP